MMNLQNETTTQTNFFKSRQSLVLDENLLNNLPLTVTKRVHAKERGRDKLNEIKIDTLPITIMNYTIQI